MNGGHDLGGTHGLGPIAPEPEAREPVFHAHWERRAFALTLAAGALGRWTLDEARHARERQHPAEYLRHSYYENWLAGLEILLQEKGLVTEAELHSGVPAPNAEVPACEPLSADEVAATMARGGSTAMDLPLPACFAPGDAVRVRVAAPAGHTRAPRYARGRSGIVEAGYGVHVFADANAHGSREGQHLYRVRFQARELWGPDAEPGVSVSLDLWEPHLEALEPVT